MSRCNTKDRCRREGQGTLTDRMEGMVEGGKGRNLTTDSICMRGNVSTTDHVGQEKGDRGTHTKNTGHQQADHGEQVGGTVVEQQTKEGRREG